MSEYFYSSFTRFCILLLGMVYILPAHFAELHLWSGLSDICTVAQGLDLPKILRWSYDDLKMMIKLQHTYDNLSTMLIYKKNLTIILR